MEPVITNTFEKQPREIKWIPISFAQLIEAQQDPARAMDPITLDDIPAGLTLVDMQYDDATSRLRLQVSGGTDGQTYLLTMWIHTLSGQKLEHQVRVKVKEKLT